MALPPWLSRSLVAALLAAAGACRYEPEGARALVPPGLYQGWWEEVQRCSRQRGDFARLRFWVLPGERFACPGGTCGGHWRAPHDVYIAEAWVYNSALVKHEMLHDLLGTGAHPTSRFGTAGCNLRWTPVTAGRAVTDGE